ncbi:MAG: hypothetical protein U1F42_05520 [Candidatus Competibacteraceae bacterium]
MHRLMVDLGQRIERERYSVRKVVRLLGKPDEIVAGGDRHGTIVVMQNERHLIYHWRGGHDYLYLTVRRGRVVRSRWWFAGE